MKVIDEFPPGTAGRQSQTSIPPCPGPARAKFLLRRGRVVWYAVVPSGTCGFTCWPALCGRPHGFLRIGAVDWDLRPDGLGRCSPQGGNTVVERR